MDLRCYEEIEDVNTPSLNEPSYMERLLQLENISVIREDYFATIQTEVTCDMRKICLEWLWEVSS